MNAPRPPQGTPTPYSGPQTHAWAALGNLGTARTYLDMAHMALRRARAQHEDVDVHTARGLADTAQLLADEIEEFVTVLRG
jgi:hypothetical protein